MSVFLSLIFSFLVTGAGFVVLCENTVYSVFYLVFVFCNATGILLYLGVDFLAMVFLIVYVGAIAVLFLFVVMMLSIRQIPWLKKNVNFAPLGLFILFFLLTTMFVAVILNETDSFFNFHQCYFNVNSRFSVAGNDNIFLIGSVLFTDYAYCFLLAGLALLIAMVGAIVLTLRYIPLASKKQNPFLQISRSIQTCNLVTR